MNNGNSYLRAQRAYDAQLPPQEPETDQCPICDGEGCVFESNCCNAAFAEPGWPDNDICSKCHEHAEPAECERCDATGKISLSAERQARKEAAEEDRADEARDERRP